MNVKDHRWFSCYDLHFNFGMTHPSAMFDCLRGNLLAGMQAMLHQIHHVTFQWNPHSCGRATQVIDAEKVCGG